MDLTFRKSLVTALEGCCGKVEAAVIMELTEQGEGRGRRSGGCGQRPVQTGGCSHRLKESGENQTEVKMGFGHQKGRETGEEYGERNEKKKNPQPPGTRSRGVKMIPAL